MRMKVYGFPGQGSQRKGMGGDLFERYPEVTAAADSILGYSVRRLCLEDPGGRLRLTQFTQPALYVVEVLTYLERQRQDPQPPDWLLGHSVGEYAALFAAGAFDFATGLRLVRRRAELMALAGGGGMAAVIGCDLTTVEAVLAEAGLTGLDIANHNAPAQFVLAGPQEELDEARRCFEKLEARCVPLNVSAAFHSRYMREAAIEFRKVLADSIFYTPRVPVLANVDAHPYRPDRIPETLAGQLDHSVRWLECIHYLTGIGDFTFTELGPGQTLSKLVSKINFAAS
ncbi:ACP S-malonyltransferase [Streptomyces ipomoeae]|uniref:ACP S-malonyltransferase n=1 Tax=Streptomyces ipomoeae TaxID=103232 RepID=UPI001147390D|nr:ACP S-malonyltransferase [Streptomyces ipomoeae]MDX2939100.1 ACP S-malonyltransferase [Streptomyces ipomoeae]TQE30890.1 ACP S-malonyltransferase [Streptomyces ipomoeae]